MDVQALEQEALAAVAAASTVDEIEQVRVDYLGRKSALKLALRDVRDRETGMALNAVRGALEEAIDDAGRRAAARRARSPAHRGARRRDPSRPAPIGAATCT